MHESDKIKEAGAGLPPLLQPGVDEKDFARPIQATLLSIHLAHPMRRAEKIDHFPCSYGPRPGSGVYR